MERPEQRESGKMGAEKEWKNWMMSESGRDSKRMSEDERG